MGLRFRINDNFCSFFVTTTVIDFLRVFTRDKYFDILVEALDICREKYRFKLVAYVFMPSRLHVIIWPSGEGTVSAIMRDFKKFTSKRMKDQLMRDTSELLPHFQRAPVGYKGQEFKLWMDRFDNVAIASPDVLETKIAYIHDNPVRAGLVKTSVEWKYSSARNYFLNDHSVIQVECDAVLV